VNTRGTDDLFSKLFFVATALSCTLSGMFLFGGRFVYL
jgi:hypothetical protein